MERLSTLLKHTTAKLGLTQDVQAALIKQRVHDWLLKHAADLKDDTTVLVFKNGELTLACGHSITLQELQPQLPALKEDLIRSAELPIETSIRLVRAR